MPNCHESAVIKMVLKYVSFYLVFIILFLHVFVSFNFSDWIVLHVLYCSNPVHGRSVSVQRRIMCVKLQSL